VEYELRDIQAFYKDTRLYFNQHATLSVLQKERANVLHLAAEFRFSDHEPRNSFLVLSDGKSYNTVTQVPLGDLFSTSPFSTTIVSNLADRSAFHPAQPLVFLVNGSSVIIVNAFPALRKAKKFFGEIFYTTLLAGNASDSAFRRAQLEMISNPEYASPHCWAPFFLWGK
jgi:CHAT domain-containing protein